MTVVAPPDKASIDAAAAAKFLQYLLTATFSLNNVWQHLPPDKVK